MFPCNASNQVALSSLHQGKRDKKSLTDMANSRIHIHRFITEVAPPQFVAVMRRRTRTMLDTISEEDRDGSYTDTLKPSAPAAAGASTSSSSSSATSVTTHSIYFSRRSFEFFGF
ncbi:hypothetical protein GQ457_09G004070 [Hibiscus cannabinus]